MAVYKEINRADGSGVTTFYRLSDVHDTVETDDSEGTATVIDYNAAQNKPSVNGVALVGNKTSEDLGLQPAGDYITNDEADAKFIDEDELEAKNYVDEAQLQEALANIEHFHREIVAALPVTGDPNVLYLVRKQGSGEDIFNEYIWVGKTVSETGYEFIGTTATDLTDYYQKEEVDDLLDGKVDKVNGKGLSEQNYTLAEKTKLAGLENYDDSEIQAEVSGLDADVNNLKSSNTNITNTLTELKPKVDSNTAAVSTIYDLLDNKMTAIRLVEQGDGWVWMNLEGSRLTYAQASAALGHENCMLFIEQLENDGKVIPAEYKSEGDHINVIFKDLDSLVHIMTCGEDDAVVTEDVTTTNGQTDFTIEDEAVGYTTKMTALCGDTSQNTTTGKNIAALPNSQTKNGITYTLNNDGTFNAFGNCRNMWNSTVILSNLKNGKYVITKKGLNDLISYRFDLYTNNGYSKTLWSSRWEGTTLEINLDENEYVKAVLQFEEGNLYIKNAYVQIEQSDTATDFEQYTGGKPSPNPDYPQDIHTVSGYNEIRVCGKNLLDIPDGTSTGGGLTVTRSNGKITFAGTATSTNPNTGAFSFILAPGTYTISSTNNNYDFYCLFKDSNNNLIEYTNLLQGAQTIDVTSNKITTLVIGVENLRKGTTYNIETSIQIEKGLTATNYEPYQGNTYPINLPEGIELCKIGTYQDYLYKDNGSWYKHSEIGKVVLNGSENWGSFQVEPSGLGRAIGNGSNVFYQDNQATLLSNKLIGVKFLESWNNTFECIATMSSNKFIAYLKDVSNLTEFTTKLASGYEVYYVLATPTTTEITDTTLLEQLNALEQITQYKHTYITISGLDLTPEADFTYIRNIVINNNDTVLGKDTYWNNEVPTSADLPSNAQEGEIRIVQDTKNVYIYDGTNWIPFDKGGEIDLSNYLAKDNTTAWIPTGAFNPATKKYVDDSVGGVFVPTKTSQLQNDSNFIGKNSNDLTYYYTKSQTYNKAEVDALISGGGGGSDISITVNGDTLVINTQSNAQVSELR